MTILVCPLSQLATLVAARRPGRVISVLDPESPFPNLGVHYLDRHLRLAFHDAHEPYEGVTIPARRHVEELLIFLDGWEPNETLLVHCRAGIGRSTATAYVAACHRNPGVGERRIAEELRRAAPLARPNEKVVALADALMDRRGRMSAAIVDTGRGLGWVDVPEGRPFEIPSRFDAG